jgi:arylsulfatase
LKADVTLSNEGKNKTIAIYINGEQVGSKELGKISAVRNSVEGLEVGEDRGTAVSTSYKAPVAFIWKNPRVGD